MFIKRHLRGYFRYLILDEIHEEKGQETAQGHAAGALAAACRKVIALTGTLIGGYVRRLTA
jgi:SNF2 family DNA or RNA helicase